MTMRSRLRKSKLAIRTGTCYSTGEGSRGRSHRECSHPLEGQEAIHAGGVVSKPHISKTLNLSIHQRLKKYAPVWVILTPARFGLSSERNMVKVTVKLLDSGASRVFFGSEKESEAWLRRLFPTETQRAHRLLACVDAVNREGFAEVDVEPYKVPAERNLLPPDYDSGAVREDPWKREGDKK